MGKRYTQRDVYRLFNAGYTLHKEPETEDVIAVKGNETIRLRRYLGQTPRWLKSFETVAVEVESLGKETIDGKE